MEQQVFTVGHSNHSTERFIELLREHEVEVLVDVRSSPYSKFASQFNQSSLNASIKMAGLKYLYLGTELGGMPKKQQFYDDAGYVLFWKIAESPEFKEAITRVLNGTSLFKVALMCGEENPAGCHRRLLLARVLRSEGICVKHIRGDGRIELEDDLAANDRNKNVQLQLFSQRADDRSCWKSDQAVLPRD